MNAAWIAVDWGMQNLRVWVIGSDGQTLGTHISDRGQSDGFEAVLLRLIEPYLNTDRKLPVICCGMVGARQSSAEAAYVSVPCTPPDGKQAMQITTTDPRLAVFILPGIKRQTPPDIMCGEETQIAGFLRITPDFDGVICLLGPHTKWVHISAGEIVSLQTFMTGEMFMLLSQKSVLRPGISHDGFEQSAFDTAVTEAMDRPQLMAAKLFGLHAASLVSDLDPVAARARLSGLLIGTELAASRPYWLGQHVAIIGAREVAEPYRLGLAAQGVSATICDADDLSLNGLKAAYDKVIIQ